MRTRITKTQERVISVSPSGSSFVYIQSKMSFYHNRELVNAKENINRPRCDYFTPKSLKAKFDAWRIEKEEENKAKLKAITEGKKELQRAIEALCVRTKF